MVDSKHGSSNITLNTKYELCAAKKQSRPGFEPWTMNSKDGTFTRVDGESVNKTSYFGGNVSGY